MRRYIVLFAALAASAFAIRTVVSAPQHETALRAIFIPMATIFVDTFNSSTTAIVLSLCMIISGFILLFYWNTRLGPQYNALRSIARELSRVEAPLTSERIDQLDRIMNRYDIVGRSWILFRATLVRRPQGHIAAQAAPDRYFDLSALERAGLNLRMFLGLPNDFVGVGLIFTFLGLVAGLYFASRSMMSADLSVARDGLVQLLHAATFKFMTSITGVGMSLILSWAQRVLIGNIESALSDIRFYLERLLPHAEHMVAFDENDDVRGHNNILRSVAS